jgi:hypothetical protein
MAIQPLFGLPATNSRWAILDKLCSKHGDRRKLRDHDKIGNHYNNSLAAKLPTFHSEQNSRITAGLRTERLWHRYSISGTHKRFFSSPYRADRLWGLPVVFPGHTADFPSGHATGVRSWTLIPTWCRGYSTVHMTSWSAQFLLYQEQPTYNHVRINEHHQARNLNRMRSQAHNTWLTSVGVADQGQGRGECTGSLLCFQMSRTANTSETEWSRTWPILRQSPGRRASITCTPRLVLYKWTSLDAKLKHTHTQTGTCGT